MSILTNNSAMVALQTLKSINKDLNTVQDQISTGLKVGSAKDSAAIWGISQVMRSDVAGFEAISESLSLGSSTVSVARSATEEISDLLQEIKGKVVSANEDNFDRAKLQTEVDQLRGQITGIVDAAQFNGLNLLKSPEGIDILSSLDRASTGSVTSSQISVAGFDFSAEAGTAGTGAATLSTSVSGTGATAATASINIDNAAAYLGANTFGLQIGDFDLSFDAAALAASGAAGTTDDDFATFLAAEINALGIEGVTATASLGGTGNSRVDLVSTASSTLALAPGTLNTVAAFTAADVTDVAGGTAITEVAGSSATTNTAATATVTFAGTAPSVAAGESIDFSFGADTFTYTNNTGAGITTNAALVTDIAAFYAANASAQVAGIDLADGGGGVLTISNTDSTESKTIAVDMSGATTASGDIVRSGPEVAAATEGAAVVGIGGGAVNEGDTFSVTIGTDQFDYIAGQNENINDVARGLQSVIASDGPSDVGVTLTLAGDVATGSAQLSITGPSGYAVSASDSRGGTATGDLYALSQIDVTTDEGAAKALNAVENLIQTVVDAASDFGSAGKRLEIQESFLSKLSDSLKSGIGALVDADMEEASARLQALQVQQQLGVQALSIANQAPQNVLSLFR